MNWLQKPETASTIVNTAPVAIAIVNTIVSDEDWPKVEELPCYIWRTKKRTRSISARL